MTGLIVTGVSWKRLSGEDNRDSVDLFKQRKAVSRHSRLSKSQERLGICPSEDNNQPTQRSSTATGTETPECSKKLSGHNLNAKNNGLYGLNDLAILQDKLAQRNCFSAVDEILVLNATGIANRMTKNSNLKPELDNLNNVNRNDKIKTLKALISPQFVGTSSHDGTNEKLKRAKNFSDGVEEVGCHLKFKVTASNTDKNLSRHCRPLNEFQLTYEQDKERVRGESGPDPCQEPSFDNATPVVINQVKAIKNGRPHGVGHDSLDRKLNEFQITHEQETMRCKSSNDFRKTSTHDYLREAASSYLWLQRSRVTDFNNLDSVKTFPFKNETKQIFKRPTQTTDRRDNRHFGTAHSQRGSQSDHQHDIASCYQDQEKLNWTRSSPALNGNYDDRLMLGSHTSTCHNGGLSDDDVVNVLENSADTTLLVGRTKSIKAEVNSLRPSDSSKQSSSKSVGLPDNRQQQMKSSPSRSQSVTPNSIRNHSDVESSLLRPASQPGSNFLQHGTSLKDHLNALGESLSSLSSKLSCRPESETASLKLRADQVKTSAKEYNGHNQQSFLRHGYSEIKQHRNTPSNVHSSFIYANNVQISLPKSDPNIVEYENESRPHESYTSKPSTVEAVQFSQLGSPTVLKQTNMKVSCSPEADQNSSMKSKKRNNLFRADSPRQTNSQSRNNLFRTDSPRQTNISAETELTLVNEVPKERRDRHHREGMASVPKHMDTGGYCMADIDHRVNGEVATESGVSSDFSDVGEQSQQEVVNKDEDVAIEYNESDDVSESNSLDSIDSNTPYRFQDYKTNHNEDEYNNDGRSASIKRLHLKLKELLNSKTLEQYQSKMSCSQATPITSVYSRSPQLQSNGKTKVHTKERMSHGQRTCKESPSTQRKGQEINFKQRRILPKRPSEKKSQKVTKYSTGDCDRLKVQRSKSTIEISLGKYNFKSSGSTLKERKRPESSTDVPYSSSKTLKCLKSQQKQCCVKGAHSSRNNILGVALEKKVHRLHQEVEERLRSQENITHGYSSYKWKKNGSSSQTAKSRELHDVSTISEDSRTRKGTTEASSAFSTSTPVKHILSGRQSYENNESTSPFNTKQSSAFRGSTKGDLASAIIVSRSETESQAVSAGQNSNEFFTGSQAVSAGQNSDEFFTGSQAVSAGQNSNEFFTGRTTSTRNKPASDVTNLQLVRVNKSHSDLDPVSTKSSMAVNKSHSDLDPVSTKSSMAVNKHHSDLDPVSTKSSMAANKHHSDLDPVSTKSSMAVNKHHSDLDPVSTKSSMAVNKHHSDLGPVSTKSSMAVNKHHSDLDPVSTKSSMAVNKHYSDLDPVPSKAVASHLKSEISQTNISNHKQHALPENKLTGTPDSPSTSLPHHTLSGHPLFARLGSNVASDPGRMSPADSLISHLDNPSIVQLLQKLYRADHETRQIIMIQVEFFKAWQHHTVSSREHRSRKEILTQKSVRSCVHRLLCSHFFMWQLRASHSRNMRQANALHRCHVLTKGFKALRWSVNQSKHLLMKLQTRVYAIRLQACFLKWKIKVEKQRRECLGNAVKQWRQYVCETQKVRLMSRVMECRIMMDVLHQWKKCFNKRLKRNIAFTFLRKTLLRQTFTVWEVHFSQCRDKKEMYSLAVLHHERMLLKSSLHIMAASFNKTQKAGTHFRCHQVCRFFLAWKKVIQVCLGERQEDMAASMEHWQKQSMKQSFANWREKLVINRAARKADFNICRKSFLVWRQAWETNVTHYQALEAAVIRNKLHHMLLAWRENVVQLQRRQTLAVALIEKCYLKHVLSAWRMYMSTKALLKRKTQFHHVVVQHKILNSCFSQWQETYKHHQQEKLARQLWSEGCARKMACQWKLICYRRSLTRLFKGTQPARDQRLVRVMFEHWVSSLRRRRSEMEQADDLYKAVQMHRLLFYFTIWGTETQRALTIKPLVERRENHVLEECFVRWKDFVLQKSKCKQSQRMCLMKILCKSLHSWRRQYLACQIEKRIKAQMSDGLLLVFLKEWWFLIHRKRKGHHFNIVRLMNQTFYCWRNRVTERCTHRAMMKRTEETNLDLKRKYFTRWLEQSQNQVSRTEQCVGQFVQKQDKAVLSHAFIFWRRYMQSTLISRAYQKSQKQRLLFTLFLAWQELTHLSVSEAILQFSEKIGLINESPVLGRSTRNIGFIGNFSQEDKTNINFGSLRSSCPTQSSFQMLAGGADQSREMGGDRMLLLTGGLQDFVVDHKAKCCRMKETIQAVIHRLMHWPVCAAFEQWKEFAAREHTLKAAFNQLKALHLRTETSMAFRDWRGKFLAAKTAQDHRNAHLLLESLKGLSWYRDHRKYVKHQSRLSSQHYMLVVLRKFFPPWLHKTQVQLNDKHIIHLWTGCTAREIELNPSENYLVHKLGQRTLQACFTLWVVKYQAVMRIRNVFHGHLLRWVFSSWQDWAGEKHDHMVKSLNMRYKRRTQMTFELWTRKLHQIKETDRRYHEAWQNYLLSVVQRWRWWAKSSHKLHLLQRLFELQQSQHTLMVYFCQWKSSAIKVKTFRTNQTKRITYSMFCGWRSSVKEIINDKQKILRCQMLSNMFLAKRLLHKWYSDYTKLKILQCKRRQYAEQCALSAGIVWRKKAQKTRGRRLEVIFLRRKMVSYIQHWKASLSNIEHLHCTLDLWNQKRNIFMLSKHFRSWRTQLIADQARKIHTCRFMCTVMVEWNYFTRVSKERHTQGLVLKKALQDRSLMACFQYWLAVTKAKQSIQQNVETRLQKRALRAWKLYTCKMCNLRELKAQSAHRVSTRLLGNAFMNMQWRFEYCVNLQEMAGTVVKEKERAHMRSLFRVWIDKLNKISATLCYEHILAVRGTRRWRRFINKRKLAQLEEKKNWKIAMDHYHQRVCKRVFDALKLEVRVSDLVARRRRNICFKYARTWKLRVDMQNAATTLGYEFVQRHAWSKWRMDLTKIRATNQVTQLLQTQLLYQVFSAWHGMGKSMKSKILPQPVLHNHRSASTQPPSLMPPSSVRPRSSPTISAANMSFGFKSGRKA